MTDYPLQRIRRVYESTVEDALATLAGAAIPVYTDNSYYADKKADSEFALVRLSFGEINTPLVGEMIEDIKGSLIVEIFVPKGKGPGRAQDVAEVVLIGLTALNRQMANPLADVTARVGAISGPRLTPLQSAPHFQARLSCAIRASYNRPFAYDGDPPTIVLDGDFVPAPPDPAPGEQVSTIILDGDFL